MLYCLLRCINLLRLSHFLSISSVSELQLAVKRHPLKSGEGSVNGKEDLQALLLFLLQIRWVFGTNGPLSH